MLRGSASAADLRSLEVDAFKIKKRTSLSSNGKKPRRNWEPLPSPTSPGKPEDGKKSSSLAVLLEHLAESRDLQWQLLEWRMRDPDWVERFLKGENLDLRDLPPYSQMYRQKSKNILEALASAAKMPLLKGISKDRSRFNEEFEFLDKLGRGGFGNVLKVRNRFDGATYAVKVIKFKQKGKHTDRVLREVTTLAKMDHSHICRYFQAWMEALDDDIHDPHHHTLEDDSRSSSSRSEASLLSPPPHHPITPSIDSLGSTFEDSLQSLQGPKGTSSLGELSFEDFTFSDTETSNGMAIVEYPVHTTPVKKEKKEFKYLLYIQMQLYESHTLKEWIEREHRIIDVQQNVKIFKQIAEGLKYIHEQGICHRDLKPANIFMTAQGNIKIGDFGLAKELKVDCDDDDEEFVYSEDCEHTIGVGTPTYAPPEQLTQKQYGHKVDIYSLGVILFEMFHHFCTYSERAKSIRELKELSLPAGFKELYPREGEIILWLLAPDPHDRPLAAEILESPLLKQNESIVELHQQLEESREIIKTQAEHIRILEEEVQRLRLQLEFGTKPRRDDLKDVH